MTCREMLKMEHPENVKDIYMAGCKGCPHHYNYMDRPEVDDCGECVIKCSSCWDREIPETTTTPTTRAEILEAAAKIVSGHRTEDYGSPEDNFTTIALLWDTYIAANCMKNEELTITAQDVAAMLILLKIGRLGSGAGSADCWVDIAGYAACGGEIAMKGGD